MRSLLKSVFLILLAVISLSVVSCGKKYVTPDYGMPPAEKVRAEQPNCLHEIESLNNYEGSVPVDRCLDIIDCSEENAIYWEYLYFDLRERIDKAVDF